MVLNGDIYLTCQEALKNHDSWMEDVSNTLQQMQEKEENLTEDQHGRCHFFSERQQKAMTNGLRHCFMDDC